MRVPPVRFTMRRLMLFVAILAAGLAVMRHAFFHWGPREIMTLVMLLFLASNTVAWFQRDRWKDFWVGFGICGWAYLMISLASPLSEHLPTNWLIDGLRDRLPTHQPVATTFDGFGDVGTSLQTQDEEFRRAGHSVLSLLFAGMGGVACLVLIPTRARDGEAPLPPDGSLLKPGWRDE